MCTSRTCTPTTVSSSVSRTLCTSCTRRYRLSFFLFVTLHFSLAISLLRFPTDSVTDLNMNLIRVPFSSLCLCLCTIITVSSLHRATFLMSRDLLPSHFCLSPNSVCLSPSLAFMHLLHLHLYTVSSIFFFPLSSC